MGGFAIDHYSEIRQTAVNLQPRIRLFIPTILTCTDFLAGKI